MPNSQPTITAQQQAQLDNAEVVFMQVGLPIKFRGHAAITDDIMQPIITAETSDGSTLLFVARGQDFHLAFNPFRDYGLTIAGTTSIDCEIVEAMIEHGENLRADADPYDRNPPFQFSCCGCTADAKAAKPAKRISRKKMRRNRR